MKIKDLGEIGFIQSLARQTSNSQDVILGIGDDAAVVKYTSGKYLLLTTDMLIEDIHFRLNQATGFQVGHKALAVNISDIAAMGGIPKYALISVGLKPSLPVGFVNQIYQGICSLANKFNIDIVGGDTNRSNKLIVNITLTGEVEKKYLVTRKGAEAGDLIFVTGSLGGSVVSKHLKFIPRLKEARALVRQLKLSSMIDISDGLSIDLVRLVEASQVGAIIYEKKIPVSRPCLKSARQRGIEPIEAALHDGEDFELLFTVSESEAQKIYSGQIEELDIPVHCIGQITNSGLKLIDKNEQFRPWKIKGYQHFRG